MYNWTSTSLIATKLHWSMLQFAFTRLHNNTSVFTESNPNKREPVTRAWKRHSQPGLCVSRPATSVLINLSEGKQWQTQAFFLNVPIFCTTRQKELMSHYAAPQITPWEKNSSLQTAVCVGDPLPPKQPHLSTHKFSEVSLDSTTDGFYTSATCLLGSRAHDAIHLEAMDSITICMFLHLVL